MQVICSDCLPVFYFLCDLGGTVLLFDRKVLRNFRKDGYNWRKKKDGKNVQEAHEKLKARLLSFLCVLEMLTFIPFTIHIT